MLIVAFVVGCGNNESKDQNVLNIYTITSFIPDKIIKGFEGESNYIPFMLNHDLLEKLDKSKFIYGNRYNC